MPLSSSVASESMIEFGGLFSVLPTPFTTRGAVDLDSLRRLVGFTVGAGAKGIVALGVMGEAAELDEEERAEVIAGILDERGGLPVVVGVSHPQTDVAARRAADAVSVGADSVMVAIPPERNRLIEHVATVARAAGGAPLILQDYPKIGHPPVAADDLVAAIRSVPAITAIKAEHPPTAAKMAAVHARAPHIAQLGGLGGLWSFWELEAGSSGCMTGFAIPELLIELIRAAHAGDRDRAWRLYSQALPALVWESQPDVELRHRKSMLQVRGLITSTHVRVPSPQTPRAQLEARALFDAVSAAGFQLASF